MLGIVMRLAATSCFGLMAAMIKLGHEAGVSTPELVFYRSLFGFPPLLAWIACTGSFGAWRTERPKAHLLRAAIGLTAMSLGFSALAYLPLAEATTIGFAAPLFAVMLSALILKELVRKHRWSAVAAGFVGVIIVMQPGGGDLPLIGLLIAVLAAFSTASASIAIRQIGRTESTETTVLWFTAAALLASGAFMPAFASMHEPQVWLILLALGLFGGIGQLFHTAALRMAPVAVIAPFDYIQLLWAVLLGWLLWDTHPPATTWIGAAIIIASGLYTLYREHRLGREKPRTVAL
jgi:RarD protein